MCAASGSLGADATGCGTPPAAEVVAVTELGPIEQPAAMRGRDGGVSGRFAGRSIWVYGDGVAAAAGTYPNTWRNNTMSWTTDATAADGLTGFVQPLDAAGAAREFFPQTADEAAFNAAHVDRGNGTCAAPCGARYAIWGGGPLEVAPGRALLSYGKIYAEPGEWNFRYVGTSIATWTSFEAGPQRPTVSGGPEPTLLFDAREGEFGIPAIADGFYYLFSCSGPHDDGCVLGRAKLDDVLRRAAWEFRSADGWTADVRAAAPLFDGSPNLTVHHSAHLGRWLAIYLDGGTIVMRTAVALDGPWSDPGEVFTPREDDAMHAHAHVELQERGGGVEYLSYLADTFRLLRVELEPR
jgi:hypothetical protein